MPLLNDVARCLGMHHANLKSSFTCDRRETCARYVERHTGGPNTMTWGYLCDLSKTAGDMYKPTEKQNDN